MPVSRLDRERGQQSLILTNIATGYSNNQFVGENLFPVVTVDKEVGKVPKWGKEAFKTFKTRRAMGADSNEMDLSQFSTIDFRLDENDLEARIDHREYTEALYNVKARAITEVMDKIKLGYELEQANLAQNLALYPSTNKVTKSTGEYYDIASVDFVKDILLRKQKVADLIGQEPNTMLFGGKVWSALRFHPILKDYLYSQNLAPSVTAAMVTEEQMKTIFGVDNFVIGKGLYVDPPAPGAEIGPFKNIWGNSIILAYVAPPSGMETTPFKPSFGYTLRKSGYPYADEDTKPNKKVDWVRATDMYAIKIVGTESAYIIDDPITPANY